MIDTQLELHSGILEGFKTCYWPTKSRDETSLIDVTRNHYTSSLVLKACGLANADGFIPIKRYARSC